MSQTRRYSSQIKADALARVAEAGYPQESGAFMQVARELNIPHTTLTYWVQNPSRPVRRSTVRLPLSQLVGQSTTVTELTVDRPSTTDLNAQLEFHRREIERIRTLLDAARDYASYKDLVTAHRTFTQDLQDLENRAINEQINDEKAVEVLIETLNRIIAEAEVSPSEDSESAEPPVPEDQL